MGHDNVINAPATPVPEAPVLVSSVPALVPGPSIPAPFPGSSVAASVPGASVPATVPGSSEGHALHQPLRCHGLQKLSWP